MKLNVRVAPGADAALGNALEDFMETVVAVVLDNAKRIVPVGDGKTGHLKDELHSEVDRIDDALVKGAVGSDKVYSGPVEVGRKDLPNYPIQPYLKPALYQTRGVRPK